MLRARGLHHRAARHVGRGAHHLLRWVGSFAAILILITLAVIWRVMQGPVELDWLAPYVEAAFEKSETGLRLTISGVRFGVDPVTRELDLRAQNVRLSLPDGALLASFPEMATSFGLSALLHGQLALTQLVVERPVLHLARDAAGNIAARVGGGDDSAPEFGPQVIEQLAGPRDVDSALGLLRRIRVRGATVVVDDRRSGQIWRADRVDVSIERSTKGVRGDLSLALPLGGSMPEFHASYRYLAERQLLDLDIAIDGVAPTEIPPLIPELAQLQHVAAPVSGTLQTRIDLNRRQALGSRLDLTLGKGRLHSDFLPTGSVALDKGEFRAIYAPEGAELRVEKLLLDLGGGAALAVDGAIAGVTPELIAAPADARPPGHVTGRFSASLTRVPIQRVSELWPVAVSPGGRRWVIDNVHDGSLDEATAQLSVDLDPVAHTAALLSAQGTMRYRDLTVNYFNGLPMAHKVSGTASFTGSEVDFAPSSGVVKGLKLTGGSLQLTNLGERVEWANVNVAVAGPLQDALEVIDSKPLQYAHAIGIDPAHVTGRTEGQLHFKLPLLADLKLDAVDYGAKATITGAGLAKFVLDRNVSDGAFTLEVGRAGAHVQGNAKFADIPTKFDGSVIFHPKFGPHAIYKIGLTLDKDAQHRLDFDVAPDRLKGPVAVDLTYSALSAYRAEATALVDLRAAHLAIAEAGWKKSVDQPATAKLVFELENDKLVRIPQIEVKAPGLDAKLAAIFASDRKQSDRFEIHRLVVGDSEFGGSVVRRPDGGWRADIRSTHADARHLMKDAMKSAPATSSPPLAVEARIDRLVFGPRRELHRVVAALVRNGGVWQSGTVEGRYANGHRLALRFGDEDGRKLTLQSDDFGSALRLLDIADGVVGGQVTIDGQMAEAGGKRVLRGHIDGRGYTLANAPMLTRILAFPSLTGIASTLSGSGLPFSDLRGDFAYESGRLTLDRMLAYGEALGVTADGWVDLDQDALDMKGTVAPAYALNSILGNVPIIGTLLGGGNQGLFAANFRLTGAVAEPQVTVNPLSALTPGILRDLFSPLVGVGSPSMEQPAVR